MIISHETEKRIAFRDVPNEDGVPQHNSWAKTITTIEC